VGLSLRRLTQTEKVAILEVLCQLAEKELDAMKYSRRAAQRKLQDSTGATAGGDANTGADTSTAYMDPLGFLGLDKLTTKAQLSALADSHAHAWKAMGLLRLANTIKAVSQAATRTDRQTLMRQIEEEEKLTRAAAKARLQRALGIRPRACGGSQRLRLLCHDVGKGHTALMACPHVVEASPLPQRSQDSPPFLRHHHTLACAYRPGFSEEMIRNSLCSLD